MEYKIIADRSFDYITSEVNQSIKGGWMPQGGLAFVEGMTAQAMTRTKRIKPTTRVKADLEVSMVIDAYNEFFKCDNVTKKLKRTTANDSRIRICIDKEFKTLPEWISYFELIRLSDFLMGKFPGANGYKRFRLDLEFVVNETNIGKILEGKFNNE